MNAPAVDIVVTVWNRPVETRSCLVSLMEFTPDARLIMVDNGSERETERLLQEFAEILDSRALLLRNEVNRGQVQAVNLGLARAEAPLVAVIRNTTRVGIDWFAPLQELMTDRPDAGIAVPRLVVSGTGSPDVSPPPAGRWWEVESGSLDAMLLRKGLIERIGFFAEDMDGGEWCLRSYLRRAWRAGYLAFGVAGGVVNVPDEPRFGSAARREENLRRSREIYREAWGESRSICIYLPRDADPVSLPERVDLALTAARQGHRCTFLLHGALFREARRSNYDLLHANLGFEPLPRFFVQSAAERILARLGTPEHPVEVVAGIDGIPVPGAGESVPFSRLAGEIAAAQLKLYRS